MVKYLDYIIYWLIIILPFSIAVAPAFTNVFMGFLIISFLVKKIIKKERIFKESAINAPLLFLFLITCLSLVNSINYRDTLRGGIIRLLQYILIFTIMLQEIKDKKQITRICLSMIFGLLFASFDAIWQVLTGKDFVRGYSPVINIGLVRATASFKDPNTFGIYLSALAPLLLGLTIYYIKNKRKIAFVFMSLVALAGVALTYSRPTLLAVYVALFFLALTKRNRYLIIFLVIVLLVFPFLMPESVKEFARQVNYNPLRFMCNDDRIAVYRNSLNMIRAHPVIGVGANTFMKNYKKYKESPEYRNVVTSDYLYAHNNFLHMTGEIGLAGLAIFIWLLYKLFRESSNIYNSLTDNYLKIICLCLIACLMSFLINGLTESSLYSSRVAITFWYLTGFLLAFNKFPRPEE